MTVLHTARLRLEPCSLEHLQGLHDMNRDPAVMRYITGRGETLQETEDMIARVQARWAELGYSWWSFLDLATGQVVGAGCIQHLGRDRAQPLEIGWRLRQDRWGQGLGSEAAQRMASFAFDELQTPLLCAVCHPDNQASAHVMKKLGMSYRGLEHWYDMDTSVYDMDRAAWLARSAP